MAQKATAAEKLEERTIVNIIAAIARHDIVVRRERLASGHSFRVKSGRCSFSNERLLFIDRRLSAEQQLGVLVDFVLTRKIQLTDDELSSLAPAQQSLLRTLPRAA